LNSLTPMSNTGTKSRIVPKFRALSFRMTVKADLSNAVDKGALLHEHISNCMALERPFYVTSQIAFYDALRLSGEPDVDGYVSSELHGYVQTNNGTRVPAIKKWIEEADWTAIAGGLAGDKIFQRQYAELRRRKQCLDPAHYFGSVWMNNHGREAPKNVRNVGCHKSILLFSFSKSRLFMPSCLTPLYCPPLEVCNVRPTP
jgi:hypothetical protein